jgi:hypothetical protein
VTVRPDLQSLGRDRDPTPGRISAFRQRIPIPGTAVRDSHDLNVMCHDDRAVAVVAFAAAHRSEEGSMPRRPPPVPVPRSPKAGIPREAPAAPARVRRRQKTAHVAVRKDTTAFEASEGVRVAWGRGKPKVPKR